MKMFLGASAALVLVGLVGSTAQAQIPYPPYAPAPFAYRGFGCYSATSFPCPLPPMPAQPFNGLLPLLQPPYFHHPARTQPSFPMSPFVRSPRDFFMYGQERNDP